MTDGTIGESVREELGISGEFVALINCGEIAATLIDALYHGKDVPRDLIDEAVTVIGQTIGFITAKYDPNLQDQ